ncbi:MAG TPA: sensor histidine kinase [Steroidobacteraceae bacterium]|nr:sensor histidine kinase [Steroidobacteraceae bacterium]
MSVHLSAKKPGWLVLRSGAQLSGNQLFWLLQGLGWLCFGLMMLGYELIWQPPLPAFIDDAVMVALGLSLTTGLRFVYRHLRRRSVHSAIVLATAVLSCATGAAIWDAGRTMLVPVLLEDLLPRPNWVLSGESLYYLSVLVTWSLLYFGTNGWISLRLERRRAERAEAMAQSARLRALQGQLEPHFLFNTLNGISALVAEGHNEAAVTMIGLLSDFLRLTLKAGGTPRISVAEEIAFVRQYLDIQKLRFGKRLRFTINVSEEALPAMVPTLLLQPLVENAVKHGILPRAAGGCVSVVVATEANQLQMRVEDDGPGMTRSSSTGAGVGLSNTATRLNELYGSASTLRVGRSALGGVSVDISLPLLLAHAHLKSEFADAEEA